MDSLKILMAEINLKTTLIKLNLSLEEIKEKHPNRKDLIDSMEFSINDLVEFQDIFNEFQDEYRLECKANFRNQLIVADHKHEIDRLNEEIKDLKTEL